MLWTRDQLDAHLKSNLTDAAGSYSAAVIVAALYFKLYGEIPKIGLSGAQAQFAMALADNLPADPRMQGSTRSVMQTEDPNAL